jgi:hypothetical protein
MSFDRSLERRVADALAAEAPARGPERLADSVLDVTARRRPRARWLTLLREPSMDLDHRSAFGSPLVRSAGILTALLVLAMLAVGTIVTGTATVSRPPVVPADRGAFTPTGSMSAERELPTATLLGDGRVLVVGGWGGTSDGATDFMTSAEIWDPATGSFEQAGTLLGGREGHTATLLQDGRVLIAGGTGVDRPPAPAEIWDPSTMSFSPTGSPAVSLFEARATLLPDGRVLIVGSSETGGVAVTSAEVWDAETGTFGPGDALPEAQYPAGTLLDEGRVLVLTDIVATDANGARTHGRWSATIWDPVTGYPSPAGSLGVARGGSFTTTRLSDGRVLVTGGSGCLKRGACGGPVADAEIWDPTTMSSSPTGPLGEPRALHAATLLRDGRVLVVGGSHSRTAEVFELR